MIAEGQNVIWNSGSGRLTSRAWMHAQAGIPITEDAERRAVKLMGDGFLGSRNITFAPREPHELAALTTDSGDRGGYLAPDYTQPPTDVMLAAQFHADAFRRAGALVITSTDDEGDINVPIVNDTAQEAQKMGSDSESISEADPVTAAVRLTGGQEYSTKIVKASRTLVCKAQTFNRFISEVLGSALALPRTRAHLPRVERGDGRCNCRECDSRDER